MVNSSEPFCFPVCVACREQGCSKKIPVKRGATRPAPNRELVMLKCGCREIPWPLMRVLGEHIDKVLCDLHGWQPIAAEEKKRAKAHHRSHKKQEIPGQTEILPY